jgi:hypothetical protein
MAATLAPVANAKMKLSEQRMQKGYSASQLIFKPQL